jgi:hypothetical protein
VSTHIFGSIAEKPVRELVEIAYCKCSRKCGCIVGARCLLCPPDNAREWRPEHFAVASDRGQEEALARMFIAVGGHLSSQHGGIMGRV